MLSHAHGEVIIRPGFGLAIQMGNPVLFDLEFAENVCLDGVVAFVADADFLVVLDVFVPVALGVQEDLFLRLFCLRCAVRCNRLPPGELRVLKVLRVLFAGRSYGTTFSLWYRQPLISGWSGSPSRKVTSTSMPMRGMAMPP